MEGPRESDGCRSIRTMGLRGALDQRGPTSDFTAVLCATEWRMWFSMRERECVCGQGLKPRVTGARMTGLCLSGWLSKPRGHEPEVEATSLMRQGESVCVYMGHTLRQGDDNEKHVEARAICPVQGLEYS